MQTYEEPGYAADRLMGTIVRHKGKAVKVDVIGAGGKTGITYISTGRREECNLRDLDITPVPLGFCNLNREATYLSRCPVRQDWKQGLRNKTLRSSSDRWGIDEIPFKAIGYTIENNYPTLKDAFQHLSEGAVNMMAWCRNFAVDSQGNIYFKALGVVGEFLDRKERRFQLKKEFIWVQESLEEVLNA